MPEEKSERVDLLFENATMMRGDGHKKRLVYSAFKSLCHILVQPTGQT